MVNLSQEICSWEYEERSDRLIIFPFKASIAPQLDQGQGTETEDKITFCLLFYLA